MCTWLAALAIGGALASTVSNTIASNEQSAARAQALAAERERQKRYTQQARGLVKKTGDEYGTTKEKQAARTAEIADVFREPAENINSDAGMLPGARGEVTVGNVKDARGKAAERVGQIGDARADLRSFGDVMGANAMQAARNSSELAMVDNFRQHSASILPMELEAANSAGGMWRTLGDVGNLVSSIATPAWLGGYNISDLGGVFAPTTVMGAKAPNGRPANIGARGYY